LSHNFYGSEILSLKLKKEHRLRGFLHRVLRKIFELRKEEERGVSREFRVEELHDMYVVPRIIKPTK
jgi:hypothetical protein